MADEAPPLNCCEQAERRGLGCTWVVECDRSVPKFSGSQTAQDMPSRERGQRGSSSWCALARMHSCLAAYSAWSLVARGLACRQPDVQPTEFDHANSAATCHEADSAISTNS
jgi:hypothetical protein